MSANITAALGARPPRNDADQLRRMCHELESVFLRQLFTTMREGVHEEDSLWDPPAGEEIFNSLLDDRLASEASARMPRGLGEAMYRQLVHRLEPHDAAAGNALSTED